VRTGCVLLLPPTPRASKNTACIISLHLKMFVVFTFISILIIFLIKKIKVIEKLEYILKLHYVINHIIFNFLYNFNFF
jgi:hypothetical protein